MGGGGETRTVVEQQPQPPQLLPEAKPGYQAAADFYQSILNRDTPVFGGKRVATPTALQRQAVAQAGTSFGTATPTPTGVMNQLMATVTGDYLGGAKEQEAVSALSAPLFRTFEGSTLPQLRGGAIQAGHAPGASSRYAGEETRATQDFGTALGQGVVAPIYEFERGRQLQAAGMVPQLQTSEQQREATRLGLLGAAGGQEQAWEQAQLDAARQAFEEPLYRRSEAAKGLAGMSGVAGPGGATTTTVGTETPGIMGGAQTGLGMAQSGLMSALLMGALKGA